MLTPTLVISKNVPLPSSRVRPGLLTATLRTLEIGDSFEVPPEYKTPHVAAGVGNRMFKPRRFVGRKQADGTYRVWRTE